MARHGLERATRRAGRAATWACLIALALTTGCASPPSTESEEPSRPQRLSVEEEIRGVLAAGPDTLAFADTTGVDSTWAEVLAFYEQRHDHPAWSNGHRPHRRAAQLLEVIERSAESGLDPRDYDPQPLARALDRTRHPDARALWAHRRALARLDVRATYAWLRIAPHMRDGRVPRGLLDPDWARGPNAGDWPTRLRRSLAHDPAQTMAALEPKHVGYLRLRRLLTQYRAIADHGGWGQIPPGEPLAIGARGPRVAALVRRLAMTGELKTPVADTVFDQRLERVIGELQTRHGIPRSGIMGEATRAILNVPVDARIRQIELNLERWRWLPDTLGRRHVAINIPAYRLELVQDDRVIRPMRVVVGRRRSPTPVFSDRLAYLEINPTWTLPKSVVVKEIVPTLKRHHDYLLENRMHVISIASAKRDTVDPGIVPWKDAASDTFMYLIVQEAGPDNPLGRIKIICPNEYDVYLHDTPQRSRFGVAVRDYSHGCVRVEEVAELADSLLGRAPDGTSPLDTLLQLTTWKRVRLPYQVPVHFLYWTAWVDDSGGVHFRDDLYGLDHRLDEALRSRTTATFVLNPGVEMSPFWLAAEARAKAATAEKKKKLARARPKPSTGVSAATPEGR